MSSTIDFLLPFTKMNTWLEKEKQLGSPNPYNIVLATATQQKIPHSRIVAIKEINQDGILFFTQRGTKKVTELEKNPHASMTLWLPLQQREIIIDGGVHPLTHKENENNWKTLPIDRQLRFSAYAPTSSQPIHSLTEIEKKQQELLQKFQQNALPMSDYYCGFRLIPETLIFYTLGNNTFSEIIKYSLQNNDWSQELLSP